MENMDEEDEEGRDSTRIHDLVNDGNLDLLQKLLADSPNLVHKHSLNGTPLAVAVRRGNIAAARILLDAGAGPLEPQRHEPFKSPLEVAAAYGDRDVFRLLLDRLRALSPAGVVVENEDEPLLVERSLFVAAEYGYARIVGDLLDTLEFSHPILCSALIFATRRWEADVIDSILERVSFENSTLGEALLTGLSGKHMRSDEISSGVRYDESDWAKHYRVISRLIDAAGVDVRVAEQSSPLLRKALEGIEMQGALEALLDKGADPNTQWENGCTALHLLAEPIRVLRRMFGCKMHEVGIRLLVDKGASLAIRDDEGATASHWAAERSPTAIFLRYYLPADLLSTNQYRETLLHYAAAGGQHETVEFLLSRGGFDVNTANSTSWTPLICALAPNGLAYNKREPGAVASARLLLRHGADPMVVTPEGWTVLHVLGSYEDMSERTPAETEDLVFEESGSEYGDSDSVFDEEDGVLDPSASAAALARELLSGAMKLPSVQSPARVCYPAPSPDDRSKRFHQKNDTWGGRVGRMFAQADGDEEASVVHGRTPLHWAAERGAVGVARVLREVGGADDDAMDGEGDIPWDIAHRSRRICDRGVWAAIKKAVE